MPHPTRRIALLGLAALAVGGLAPRNVSAHPLPGTVIVLSASNTRLSLSISLPVDDLALAMGGQMPQPAEAGPVTPDFDRALATYFADHMSLAADGAADLDLTLTRAHLARATHDHVGAYTLLVLDFSAPLATGPLTLTYDAIMHEVRNHSATVFLQSAGQDAVPVGLIRLDTTSGKTAPLVIPDLP
jgi:hypothetical protein